MTSRTETRCYLDSSVAIHVLDSTRRARAWFDAQVGHRRPLVSSGLLGLEVARYLVRVGAPGACSAVDLLDAVEHLPVDDDLLTEAAAVPTPLKSLDCLHLASAVRVGPGRVIVATHDKALARAAAAMGFETTDPLAHEHGGEHDVAHPEDGASPRGAGLPHEGTASVRG
ncbi:type II toxin-antitoxin system VapC family toxin [Cellulomonas triticagri]|uniref:PIN domain-containing protein n=1 Tax=Cellulomonas triticagri TaxID=2483352 RepID=A0A3M2JRU1_9CELL|nr:PIN domain-containing protein [Cellulomonas triticagri]RMI13445.1 PIN domain-containing protein [Cellulomonas triticagri]